MTCILPLKKIYVVTERTSTPF